MKSPSFLLGDDNGEQIESVSLSELIPFDNHPFQVLEDESMTELVDSIRVNGVAVPIIVRPKGRGTFEIIAGHRRSKACELLGMSSIPAFIRDLNDEQATLQMVDTNIQREQLLPSEKAFAYKMKLEALSRQGQRSDLTCDPVEHKLKSRDLLGVQSNDSGAQIQRFIRLTYLIPELLQRTDEKKLPFRVAVELSYLSTEEQGLLWDVMDGCNLTPSLEEATQLKKYSKEGQLTTTVIETMFQQPDNKPVKLSLKADMSSFFPKDTSKKEMESVIIELLSKWKESQ